MFLSEAGDAVIARRAHRLLVTDASPMVALTANADPADQALRKSWAVVEPWQPTLSMAAWPPAAGAVISLPQAMATVRWGTHVQALERP